MLKWLQEVFLEIKARKLILDQELVSELSEGIDGEDGDVEVLVATHVNEVLRQHLPNPCPHESDPSHVEVGDLHELLQAELSGVDGFVELRS